MKKLFCFLTICLTSMLHSSPGGGGSGGSGTGVSHGGFSGGETHSDAEGAKVRAGNGSSRPIPL